MFLSGARRDFFWALALRLAPGCAELDAEGRARFFAVVEAMLAAKPEEMRRLLALFLCALRWLPALRRLAPLERLSPERQDAALAWFQDAPALALRQGFWGVKALVYMGYYGQPELGERFGYRPARDGNRILHAR